MAFVQSSPEECAKDDHAISSHHFSCKWEIWGKDERGRR